MDLPVTLNLVDEKSIRRIFEETISILVGLPHLARNFQKYGYDPVQLSQYFTADDWGFSPGVNEGILELARLGIVKRVSILANSRWIGDGLEELKAIPGIQLGLHFNLTYGYSVCSLKTSQPKLFPHSSPGRFLLYWLFSFSNRAAWVQEIRQELEAQFQVLDSNGISISYLDGHHHIHMVPGLLTQIHNLVSETSMGDAD